MDASDGELLEAWRSAHDEAALHQLCERYGRLISSTCQRLGSPDAQEATQAVMLVLARRASAIQPQHLAGWLTVTAQQVVSHQLRSARRRVFHESRAVVEQRAVQSVSEPDPLWDEARTLLDEGLASLSPARREAVIRFYLHGRPQSEIAEELGCSTGAVKMRVHEGLERLRLFFNRRGVRVSAPAVLGGLAIERHAALLPFSGSGSSAVAAAVASSPGAAALASSVGAAVAIPAAMLASVSALVISSGVALALVVGPLRAVIAPAAAVVATSPAGDQGLQAGIDRGAVVVTPRGWSASDAFADLRRRGGVQVAFLGDQDSYANLGVPVALRFHPATGRQLITAVAATRSLVVTWTAAGSRAVLSCPQDPAAVLRQRQDLGSGDAQVRRLAAWRARWVSDPSLVPLLVQAATDADAQVAMNAQIALHRLGWEAVITLAPQASGLLLAAAHSHNLRNRADALAAVWLVPGDATLHLLEHVLHAVQPNAYSVRMAALDALGQIGSAQARGIIEALLRTPTSDDPPRDIDVLGTIGASASTALLNQVFLGTDGRANQHAVIALARIGLGTTPGDAPAAKWDQVMAQLTKALGSSDSTTREGAATALGEAGGEQALSLLRRLVNDPDTEVRQTVATSLGHVGSPGAVALLAPMLQDANQQTMFMACQALSDIGSDQARSLLAQALTATSQLVRITAAEAIGHLDREQAIELLGRDLRRPLGLAPHMTAFEREGANCSHDADLSALGAVGGPDVIGILETAMSSDVSQPRAAALSAMSLVLRDAPRSVPAATLAMVLAHVSDADEDCRGSVTNVAGALGGEAGVAVLERLITDPQQNVRRFALEILGAIADGRSAELLQPILASTDDGLRDLAYTMLGECGTPEALPLLMRGLTETPALRTTVVNALASYGGPRSSEALRGLLSDADATVCATAAAALADYGGDAAVPILQNALVGAQPRQRVGIGCALGNIESPVGQKAYQAWLQTTTSAELASMSTALQMDMIYSLAVTQVQWREAHPPKPPPVVNPPRPMRPGF